MKRIFISFLLFSLLINFAKPFSVHAEEDKQTKAYDYQQYEISYSEELTDESGNLVRFEVYDINDKICSLVYVNGELTQEAIIDYEKDEILYTDYKEILTYNLNVQYSVETLKCSDFICDVEIDESTNAESIETLAFDASEWVYYGYYEESTIYTNTKPCTLYFINYDENPYDNKYLVKNLSIGAGTAVSIVVGLISTYLTGGITVYSVVATFASAIVADVITNAITGQICFSTQKIRYAPVIDGVNIFPDAYITKRYVVTYDSLHGKMSYLLDQEAYDFNRGETPTLIARNAQVCEATSR